VIVLPSSTVRFIPAMASVPAWSVVYSARAVPSEPPAASRSMAANTRVPKGAKDELMVASVVVRLRLPMKIQLGDQLREALEDLAGVLAVRVAAQILAAAIDGAVDVAALDARQPQAIAGELGLGVRGGALEEALEGQLGRRVVVGVVHAQDADQQVTLDEVIVVAVLGHEAGQAARREVARLGRLVQRLAVLERGAALLAAGLLGVTDELVDQVLAVVGLGGGEQAGVAAIAAGDRRALARLGQRRGVQDVLDAAQRGRGGQARHHPVRRDRAVGAGDHCRPRRGPRRRAAWRRGPRGGRRRCRSSARG
jgi:hypothetical protein